MSDIIAQRQGALLGHQRVERRRDPRRLGHRRPAPPAQAGDGAAAVPPVPPPARRAGVRAASTTTSASASPPGARWPAACSPASTGTACRRAAAARSRTWASCAKGLTDPAKNAAVAQLEPIAAELGASVAQLAIAWVGEESARLDRDHRRLEPRPAAGQPRRRRRAAEADARGDGAHRRSADAAARRLTIALIAAHRSRASEARR